jgi:hypothetical protein
MTDTPRFMALRCTPEESGHPLDEHGRVTLADPDGDIWAWPSEHVGPWLSVAEVEDVGRMVRQFHEAIAALRAIEHERGSRVWFGELADESVATMARLAPLRDRLGWP